MKFRNEYDEILEKSPEKLKRNGLTPVVYNIQLDSWNADGVTACVSGSSVSLLNTVWFIAIMFPEFSPKSVSQNTGVTQYF